VIRRAARAGTASAGGFDASTRVGSLSLPCAVLTASGTAGHGAELGAYQDLSRLGAVVVKSLAAFEWSGNPAPRVAPVGSSMLNSVGLQGPGVARWLVEELPALQREGARVVVSLWGRTVEDYRRAAELVASAPSEVVAVEVNVSCPNLAGGHELFAHSPEATAEVLAGVVAVAGRPCWAKLSPNTDRLVAVARAAREAGAEAVTLVNTVLGMALDPQTLRPVLGAGGGGLSGPAIHPVAVRAVHEVARALPGLPIVGVGGVVDGWSAAELLAAGACAVGVGTASFADPRAPSRVAAELEAWCRARGLGSIGELVGAAGPADGSGGSGARR